MRSIASHAPVEPALPSQVRGANPEASEGPWVALDDPLEWAEFSEPAADRPGLWESGISVSGMYCVACALKIEAALMAVPGVSAARVGAASGRVQLQWSPDQTRPSQWLDAVQAAGYQPWPQSEAASAVQRAQHRKTLWRWLASGLCMMQVMMYSVPVYLAGPGEMTPDVLQLMHWAGWVLSLPVVFFSCSTFFASAWRDLCAGRIGMDFPVALGIGIAFAVSSAATFDPAGPLGGEVWFDSLTMFVFFLLTGRWLEARLRSRTAGALEALLRRVPLRAERLLADGRSERVSIRRLALGDVIRVRPGEVFPADGQITRGETQVDEALLTGEARPVMRAMGAQVLAGSCNLDAVVELRIAALGKSTRFAAIAALMEAAALDKPRLALLADRLAMPFLLFVLAAAGASAAFWWSADPAHALMTATAVLIVTCPCALSLATPVAMLASAGALARNGVLLGNLHSLEALSCIDTVVFDKTGTLTTNRMELAGIRVRAGVHERHALGLAATLADGSLHPASRALAGQEASRVAGLNAIHEIPGQGVQGQLLGQVLRLGRAGFCGVAAQATDAYRVYLSDSQGWMASFELREFLRPEAAAAVEALQSRGLQVQILSGDRQMAVERLAQRLGIAHARGDCSVQDKLEHMQQLQSAGRRVAMVGDGINDAPVLALANVSIAMGNAVPLAQRGADCVMEQSDLSSVTRLVDQGRKTMRIVRQNLAWALAYNLACIPLAIVGWIPAWLAGLGMAISSLLVVLNAARLAHVPRTSARAALSS